MNRVPDPRHRPTFDLPTLSTVQVSGLRPCASLAAYNSSASVLAKKRNAAYLLQHPLPMLFIFSLETVRSGYLRVTLFHLAKKEEHAAHRGQSQPKQHFFRENPFWCFEGSWERQCRWLRAQPTTLHRLRIRTNLGSPRMKRVGV